MFKWFILTFINLNLNVLDKNVLSKDPLLTPKDTANIVIQLAFSSQIQS